MNEYTAQNTIRLGFGVTLTATGAAVDPATVTLSMRLPDGTISDLSSSVVRDAAGAYHSDYVATMVGLHMYEWRGTGNAAVTKMGQFLITRAPW